MNTTLILVRHGETRLNKAGVFQGQLDEPLSEVGREQVRAAAPALAALRPDVLYSSDLGRAQETAAEVAALTGLEVLIDARLGEIDCGSWEGVPFAEISAADPEYDRLRLSGADFRRSPTGETAAEVADRVAEALGEIVERHRGKTILVASHGLAIEVGVARVAGIGISVLGTMNNAHYAVVEFWPNRVQVLGYNVPPVVVDTGR